MGIKWRLGVLAIQLGVLLLATYAVEGKPVTNEVWFFAGLLAIVINPQLLEPYYPRPGDVIGNSLIFLFLYLVAEPVSTATGWRIAVISVAVILILAVIGITGKRLAGRPSTFNLPLAARRISQIASAQVLYSALFILSLLEYRPSLDRDFWTLGGAWAGLVFLRAVNWQRIWTSAAAGPHRCQIEGQVGPAVIVVTAPRLPSQGERVIVKSRHESDSGVMIRRILRTDDVWGQIHLSRPELSESLLADGYLDIEKAADSSIGFVGAVDAGSTDRELSFIATTSLQIGQVLAVPAAGKPETNVLYQIVGAQVESTDIKSGAHLFTRARAAQLGVYHREDFCLRRHPWTPQPGAPVVADLGPLTSDLIDPPPDWETVGHVIGTKLPVYLDLEAVSTGHVAILGMTKMGKSTLAERLARSIGRRRQVTILDITGEYVNKKGFPRCSKTTNWDQPGVSVFEPEPGEVPAVRAENFLKFLLEQAMKEYEEGTPSPRTIIIDEAHQFIPEPAGLGFNAPGRDNSFRIGLMLMQIRKFGISVILISQRTAVVAKSALSQCENLVAFRSVDQTGLDYLEALAGGEVRPILPKLQQGEALVFGPAISSELPVAVSVFMESERGYSVENGQEII